MNAGPAASCLTRDRTKGATIPCGSHSTGQMDDREPAAQVRVQAGQRGVTLSPALPECILRLGPSVAACRRLRFPDVTFERFRRAEHAWVLRHPWPSGHGLCAPARSRSFMKCKSMLATVLICACGGGCAPQRVEEATDTVTLPGGAVLTNTTYVTLEDHRTRHNELSYQEHASAGTETIAHLMDVHAGPPLSLRNPEPRIYQTGDRTTIGLDRYALQRWMMKDRPYWYRVETNPDQVASVFLRSFMKAGAVVADTPRRTPRRRFPSRDQRVPVRVIAIEHVFGSRTGDLVGPALEKTAEMIRCGRALSTIVKLRVRMQRTLAARNSDDDNEIDDRSWRAPRLRCRGGRRRSKSLFFFSTRQQPAVLAESRTLCPRRQVPEAPSAFLHSWCGAIG
jgi:hypothetical protein